jgi:hydrogenase maturation protease
MLVIGYGNTLRSDDGVGIRVAEAIEELNLAGVEVICRGVLTPELAEPISRARLVVFVDASVEAREEVRLRPLEPADSGQILAHAADPRALLALAREVFGSAPKAWWLTIPAENIGIGEELSAKAQKGVARAVEEIRKMQLKTI